MIELAVLFIAGVVAVSAVGLAVCVVVIGYVVSGVIE